MTPTLVFLVREANEGSFPPTLPLREAFLKTSTQGPYQNQLIFSTDPNQMILFSRYSADQPGSKYPS